MTDRTDSVELQHLTSFSSEMSGTGSFGTSSQAGSWQNEQVQVGRINPTYHTISESEKRDSNGSGIIDPSTSDRMYDEVGKGKTTHSGPHSLPSSTYPPSELRHTTSNALYASRGDTMIHPAATLEKRKFSGEIENEMEFPVSDSGSFKCCRVVCLSLLVVISLLMACVAVVLVLLLWFGVFVPDGTCPTTTVAPCTCPDVNLEPYYNELNAQTAMLNSTISELQSNLSILQAEVMSSDTTVTASLDEVEFIVNNVTNTCAAELLALSSQNVSLADLSFDAQLLDVGVYNSCVYEYLAECEMPHPDDPLYSDNCSTDANDIIVPGYFNLDIACHVELDFTEGETSVLYAAVSNLRVSYKNGTNFGTGVPASELLSSGQMRCDCTVIDVVPQAFPLADREIDFTCRLFRARCPITSTLNTTIVTPP